MQMTPIINWGQGLAMGDPVDGTEFGLALMDSFPLKF
jgi:hypothetical protein